MKGDRLCQQNLPQDQERLEVTYLTGRNFSQQLKITNRKSITLVRLRLQLTSSCLERRVI